VAWRVHFHEGMKKPHAEHAYDVELDRVRVLLDSMATLVEAMLAHSLRALALRDAVAARQIATRDAEVNALEVEIDERCLKLLARWQPAGSDLRFLAAALKLVTDLERIGDQCANICARVIELGPAGGDAPTDLDVLTGAVPALLGDALAAWRGEDAGQAGAVVERGQRIGLLVREIVRSCFETSRDGAVAPAIHWHDVATHLERIGAHATNVAELVIFLVRGEDVRHRGRLPEARRSTP
jgi:phosphate transport system protein